MDFEPEAYLRDAGVLTLAAQGLWMQMLCWMHESNPRGYLTTEEIVSRVDLEPSLVENLLEEMRKKKIFDENRLTGDIICRRMAREKAPGEKLKKAAERVQQNPPPDLLDWVRWWNGMAERGAVKGATGETKIPIELCRAWVRIQKNTEVKELLQRRTEIEQGILAAPFVKNFLTLPKLFGGRNNAGEYLVRKILEGHYIHERTVSNKTQQSLGWLRDFADD